jgi:hypothetical protein
MRRLSSEHPLMSTMQPDVVFTVIFLKDRKHLASPTVLGEFGREVCVAIPGEMRVDGGVSIHDPVD